MYIYTYLYTPKPLLVDVTNDCMCASLLDYFKSNHKRKQKINELNITVHFATLFVYREVF